MAVFVDVSDTREGFEVGFDYDEWAADIESTIGALPGVLEYMINNEPLEEFYDESEGEGYVSWESAGIWFEATSSAVKELDIWGPGVNGFGFIGKAVPTESLDWLLSFVADELWVEGEQHSLDFRGDMSVNPDTLAVSGSVKDIYLSANDDGEGMSGKYVKLSGSIMLTNDDWAGAITKMEWGSWTVNVALDDEYVFTPIGKVSVKIDAAELQATLEEFGFAGLMGSALGGSDSITGTVGGDYLDASSGNDKVFGLAGDDQIFGGDGNDKLDGGEGNDYLEGGAGNDAITDLAGNNEIVDLEGNVKVTTGGGNDLVEVGDGNAKVIAGDGNNGISAGDGNNNVTTGSGIDEIELGNGNNKVVAGDGENSVAAGDGNNNVTAGSAADSVELGNGNNKVVAGDGDNYVAVGNGNNNVSTGAGDDTIETGDGKNKVVAGTGNDSVSTGAGADSIKTDLGADEVNAGAGKNTVDLGADTDVDTVYFGADFFDALQAQAPAFNQLKNFNRGDELAFDNDLGLVVDDVLVSNTASISDAAGYNLIFNTSTGKLYYDADGTGTGQEAIQIGLVKGAALAGDFDVAVDGGFMTIESVPLI